MPPYDYQRLVLCLLWESGELRAINPFLVRCTGCQVTLSRSFFITLRQIRTLPVIKGDRACECGRPRMRGLSDDGYWYLAYGTEGAPRLELP